MKYNKMVVLALMVLSLFSGSCLIATYKINSDIKELQIGLLKSEIKVM